MATESRVLELINSLTLQGFASTNFESKHLVGFESDDKSGHIDISGQSRAFFSDDHEFIWLNIDVNLNAIEDQQKSANYTFSAYYQTHFSLRGFDIKDLEAESVEASDLLPILNSITWPLIRRHLIGSLENAGFGAVNMPFTPPADLLGSAV